MIYSSRQIDRDLFRVFYQVPFNLHRTSTMLGQRGLSSLAGSQVPLSSYCLIITNKKNKNRRAALTIYQYN